MKQLIYVVSATHSGSTVFNTILGTAPNVVSLGEVTSTFNRLARGSTKRSCTCGATLADCPVWGPVAARGRALAGMPVAERYALLVDAVDSVHGPDCTIADASKSWQTLEALLPVYGERMRVVFLTKDIRGFVGGRISKRDRKSFKGSWYRRYLRHLPDWLSYYLMWLRVNRRFLRILEQNDVEFLRVGYEELCLATDRVLPRVAEFLDLDELKVDLDFDPGRHHIVHGNKFFIDGGVSELRYDFRWLHTPGMTAANLAARPFARLNRYLVYSNVARLPEPKLPVHVSTGE